MISVYIHIPFCNTMCSYCDFCKMTYNKEWAFKYLDALKEEIKTYYKGEKVRTLYIGGGTPSILDVDELNKLFEIVELLDLEELEEFTVECNIESLNTEKLILFKRMKVNRLSIGIQSFDLKYLKLLNRHHDTNSINTTIESAKNIGFNNINVDLIYAMPGQTLEELKKDLEQFLRLNVSHISCYSLIIEPNTKLYINKTELIDEDLDYEMYKYIENTLISSGMNHYEISNYAVSGFESKHNLVYWNNEHYYGFGLGASGYLKNIRYDNTRNIIKYIKQDYISNITKVNEEDIMKYEFILGFRKINGINKEEFKNKYNINIKEIEPIKKMIEEGKLIENSEYISIHKDWIYKSNEILMEFV